MNVEQVCRLLDNRMYHLLMFEGRPVKLRSDASACRQLYTKWQGDTDYETFKQQLRFHFESGWLMVNVQKDYTPLVAGLATAAGLGAGYGLYRLHKNRKTGTPVKREAVQAASAKKSIAERVRAGGENFPELATVEQLVESQQEDVIPQTVARAESVVCPISAQWSDAKPGTRPALFEHNVNSCYFHASMLMLYQMKDWIDSNITEKGGLLGSIKTVLDIMSKKDRIPISEFEESYKLVQHALDGNGIPNQQQDANEFIVYLISQIADKTPIQFETQSSLNYPPQGEAIEIKKLVCDGIPISVHNVAKFAEYWGKLSGQQKNLSLYTQESGVIVPKDETWKGKRACTLTRGGPSFDDVVDFKVEQKIHSFDHAEDTILKVVVRPGVENSINVCTLIENEFNGEQVHVVGRNLGPERPLFDVKVKQTTTFSDPNQFCIVHLKYRPNDISGKSFQYCNQVELQNVKYDLTCVIFRSGCGVNSGHYTAALKIEADWIFYNDLANARKIINGNLSSVPGTPFMMLFKRVEQEERKEDD